MASQPINTVHVSVSASARKSNRPSWLLNLKSKGTNYAVDFANNADFQHDTSTGDFNLVLSIGALSTHPRYVKWMEDLPAKVRKSLQDQYTFNCQVQASWDFLRISEGYGDGIRYRSDIPLRDLQLLSYQDGTAVQPGTTHDRVFIFKLQKSVEIQWQADAKKCVGYENHSVAIRQNGIILASCDKKQEFITQQATHIRITVKSFVANESIWNSELVAVLKASASNAGSEGGSLANRFYKKQWSTAIAEQEFKAQQREQMTRDNVKVKFINDLPLTGRQCLELRGPESWNVSQHSAIKLEYTGNDSSVFQLDPGYARGVKGVSEWRGTTYIKNNSLYCVLANKIPGSTMTQINQGFNIVWKNIKVTFPEDSDERQDMLVLNAIKAVSSVIHQELHPGVDLPRILVLDDFVPHLRLSMSNLFLPEVAERTPDRDLLQQMRTKSDGSVYTFDDILELPSIQLSHESHVEAIRTVFRGKHSRSIIQGPPATGKTTMLAKLVCLVARFVELQGRKIVVTAYTNEAVRVACTRTLEMAMQLFGTKIPERNICLVTTDSVDEFWLITGKKLDDILQKATLRAHLDRHSAEDPQNYAVFIEGSAQLKRSGRLDFGKADHDKFEVQRRELIRKVKGSVDIFFATMSTIHGGSSVFGRGKLDVEILFADEMSQANDPAIGGAIAYTNPYSFVGLGDHQQLCPYADTQLARTNWGESLFEGLVTSQKPGSAGIVRLNEQYRTHSKIYAGTNAHYQHSVVTPGRNDNRPRGQFVSTAIKRISFKDADGKVHNLEGIAHVFNALNGKCEEVPGTASSRNKIEGQFSLELVGALAFANVPPSGVMLLTGYQGQYDLIQDHVKNLIISGLSIRKVDSAQGDEAEIVIFNLVRDMNSKVGFMKSVKRQNVATSRARECFFVVGSVPVMQTAPAWVAWYNALAAKNKGLTINFTGPVTWMIDDVVIKPLSGTGSVVGNELASFRTVAHVQTNPIQVTSTQASGNDNSAGHQRSVSTASRTSAVRENFSSANHQRSVSAASQMNVMPITPSSGHQRAISAAMRMPGAFSSPGATPGTPRQTLIVSPDTRGSESPNVPKVNIPSMPMVSAGYQVVPLLPPLPGSTDASRRHRAKTLELQAAYQARKAASELANRKLAELSGDQEWAVHFKSYCLVLRHNNQTLTQEVMRHVADNHGAAMETVVAAAEAGFACAEMEKASARLARLGDFNV